MVDLEPRGRGRIGAQGSSVDGDDVEGDDGHLAEGRRAGGAPAVGGAPVGVPVAAASALVGASAAMAASAPVVGAVPVGAPSVAAVGAQGAPTVGVQQPTGTTPDLAALLQLMQQSLAENDLLRADIARPAAPAIARMTALIDAEDIAPDLVAAARHRTSVHAKSSRRRASNSCSPRGRGESKPGAVAGPLRRCEQRLSSGSGDGIDTVACTEATGSMEANRPGR